MERKVNYQNSNIKSITISAIMHLPEGFDESKKYAAIVCTHPAGGVKEQTSGHYAGKMAELGYIGLAFDASYQGESTGEPRGYEDPMTRVSDIQASIDYLMTLPYVDEQRIGVLGVCAGGGYAIKAAQIDHRIKAVVGIVPIDLGLSFREGLYGTAPDDVFGILDAVANTRTAEARGAEMAIGGWVADEFNPNDTKEMQSCYSYYKMDGRGKHPRSNSKFPFVNFDRVIAFSSFDDMLAKLLRQPICLVTGDEAGTRWQTEKAYEKASGKKELHYVKGAHHFDLYDHRSDDAVAFVAPFLEQNL